MVVPEASPLQPSNWNPASGVAVKVTTVPSSYVPPVGFGLVVTVPSVALIVNAYVNPILAPSYAHKSTVVFWILSTPPKSFVKETGTLVLSPASKAGEPDNSLKSLLNKGSASVCP